MRDESVNEKRRREVLEAVVRLYVSSGEPVGSKAISALMPDAVSSATIRNVMADLESNGYLEQPHVSAGRIPTDKAYRSYVDSRERHPFKLEPRTEKLITERLTEQTQSGEALMAAASRILSEVSRGVGIVLGPALEEKLLEHIKLIKLPDNRVLAVIVSRPDLIENRVLTLEEDFAQEELDRTANFLNAEFKGWSLRTIRLAVLQRMEVERILYDRLLKSLAALFTWGALAGEDSGPLYIDGTARILDQGVGEVGPLKELLDTFEQKGKLVRILNACLQTAASGVQTLIGRENPERQMQHFSFVVAPLRYRERPVGALSVLGPKRMEYDRAITAVSYVAYLCSRLLSSN
jgi:heat-inducible transcriptional repressor